MSCSCEFSGTIRRKGAEVQDLAVNDRVVVMAPGRFGTVATVPDWACVKLLPEEDFAVRFALSKNEQTDVRC